LLFPAKSEIEAAGGIPSRKEIRDMHAKKKSPSAEAEDRMIAGEIAKAQEFSAYYRNGPHEKYIERGIPTYRQAAKRRDELVAEHSQSGRGGLVYAITKLGSFDCTPELIALAREIAPDNQALAE
jgi:hypothetical protein